MKNLVLLALLALAIVAGFAIGSWWQPEQGNGQTDAGRERRILYWKAPMDPNYRRDAPGKSPMGMDLVPVYADEAAGQAPGVVAIDPVVVNNLGIRTAPVEYGVLNRQINTVGYVAYDEDTLRQVNTRVDGWVEKLGVTAAGDPVERGQVLFEFYSPALVNAQQEYLATMRSSNAKLKKATRERLIALGISTSEISRLEKERTVRQRQRVYASRDGVVTQLGIRQGSYITPATNIMAIASLDQVWLLAEVFERQAAWISAGQPAEVELEHLPGQKHEGTLDYIYPQLDPTTRTLQVRIRLDNAGQKLRPNMYARVKILGAESAAVVHIPRAALIRGGSVDRVVLAMTEGKFRSQAVEAGMESGERIEIRNGLAAGDRVVTSGQFLIDSESNIDTALQRMENNQ